MPIKYRLMMFFAGAALLPVGIVSLIIFTSEKNQITSEFIDRQRIELKSEASQLEGFVDRNNTLSSWVSELPPLPGINRSSDNNGVDPRDGSTTEEWIERLKSIFSSNINSNQEVDQMRYIDENGVEKVRVDNENGKAFVVDDKDLSDKSQRDYTKSLSQLPEDANYTSTIDLNVENGIVEEPFKPTIRFATPVYQDGDYRGFTIINIDPTFALNEIQATRNTGSLTLTEYLPLLRS